MKNSSLLTSSLGFLAGVVISSGSVLYAQTLVAGSPLDIQLLLEEGPGPRRVTTFYGESEVVGPYGAPYQTAPEGFIRIDDKREQFLMGEPYDPPVLEYEVPHYAPSQPYYGVPPFGEYRWPAPTYFRPIDDIREDFLAYFFDYNPVDGRPRRAIRDPHYRDNVLENDRVRAVLDAVQGRIPSYRNQPIK